MVNTIPYNGDGTGSGSLNNAQLNVDQVQSLFDTAKLAVAKSAGSPNPNALYSTILSQYDRFGSNTLLSNHESVGYTFITRPKLNLTTTSLRQDRVLQMLNTTDVNSLPFAIRCYLDTKFSQRHDVMQLGQSPFFNNESPFIIPLSNNLVSIAGWPDPTLETETTDGGFFSEDMTIVKGSDRLNRTYDLTLTFRDIQGGFIIALLYMWYLYIQLVVRGDTIAYPEDIDLRRINYTCSIYRFAMDSSRQFITKWAKATGCFPKSIPIGNIFNFGDGEKFITSSAQYSIPFTANKVEYWDPIIFRDFNTISKRFSPTLRDYPGNRASPVDITPSGPLINQPFQFITDPANNFTGLPFVDLINGYNQLLWIANPGDTTNKALDQLNSYNSQAQNAYSQYTPPATPNT